ncbi:MAG: nitroreductase family protein [Candidatus Thorarchaeota archaeon]|nr:nitroreductase family protein [Candidatus Thorarchaeota archaeon]
MDIPVNSWFNAISLRHSQRKYSGEKPDENVVNRLDTACSSFHPFAGARAVLVREPGDDVFKGIVGSYFKVSDAPYYMAFIGDMTTPNVQEVAGYIGEGVILEATALGLNTCWVGGFINRDAVLKQIDMQDNERVLAITPIGYSKADSDRVGLSSKNHKRKDLNKLIVNGDLEESSWSRTALEAARLAPSAANRQPWRFAIKEDSIVVSVISKRREFGVSRRLDCGIAMLHLELGALSTGASGMWKFLEPPNVASYRTN